MLEAAIHRAKQQQDKLPLVELAQVAALKFVLTQVQRALEQAREQLRKAAALATERDRQAVTAQTVWFTRSRLKLRSMVASQVLEHLRKVEAGPLADLRASLHGERWTLPEHVLVNPLLFGETAMDDELLMKHYVLIAQGSNHPYSFAQVDRVLLDLFWRRQPVTAAAQALSRALQGCDALIAEQNRIKRKRGWALGMIQTGQFDSQTAALEEKIREATAALEQVQAAYVRMSYGWADVPANAELLFDTEQVQRRIDAAHKARDSHALAVWQSQRRFQRKLLRAVEARIIDRGLMPSIVASYETAAVYKSLASVVTAHQLHQYLANPGSRGQIQQRIRQQCSPAVTSACSGRLASLTSVRERPRLPTASRTRAAPSACESPRTPRRLATRSSAPERVPTAGATRAGTGSSLPRTWGTATGSVPSGVVRPLGSSPFRHPRRRRAPRCSWARPSHSVTSCSKATCNTERAPRRMNWSKGCSSPSLPCSKTVVSACFTCSLGGTLLRMA
jgi:hypothetical protein